MPGNRSRKSRWLPRLFGLTIVGLAAAAVVYAFLPQPVLVDLARVTRGTLQVTVSEDGKTRIKERYIVAAPLSGQLLRIDLDPGDLVYVGETLVATIQPMAPSLLDARAFAEAKAREEAARVRLEQAEPLVKKTKEQLDFQESELARMRHQVEKGVSTQAQLSKYEVAYRTADQDYKSALFDVEIAKYELQLARAATLWTKPSDDSEDPDDVDFAIRSPITGRVLRVFEKSARVVTPGENLLEVGDPSDLEIVVDVLSSDAVTVEPGNRVLLEHWGGTRPLRGTVRLVEPSGFTKVSALGVEEQRVNVIIDFLDPPDKRPNLGDGFRVDADIITWEGADVLKVPTSALFRHEGGWAVFVVRNGRAVRRAVELGRRNGLEAEITDGLKEGATVIVHPGDAVREGAAVAQRTMSE